jgi:hypothetical protein
MIRRVSFKKAIIAGLLGAVAWDAAARILELFGVPIFDLVHVLGSIAAGAYAPAWKWWTAGMLLHCTVGAIWAIFYAYFFWSTFDYRPVVQGVLFSLLPTLLAGLVMVPQLYLMQTAGAAMAEGNGIFAIGVGAGGPLMLVIGHLVYGSVLGSLYIRPVGYPTGGKVVPYG